MYLFSKINRSSVLGALAVVSMGAAAEAATIEVTVTNTQAPGGLYFTPLLGIFHDGNYDTFNFGANGTSAGVTAIAEGGDVSVERAAADADSAVNRTEVLTSPGGFPGAPVFDPSEAQTFTFDLDETEDLYFTFLSMIIPSNDLFVGNADPRAYKLFDANGDFTGLSDIRVYGSDVWDNGTEANDNQGAAFNAAGGTSSVTDEGVTRTNGNLDFLLGENTAAGTTISSVPGAGGLIATISFNQVAPVPLPAALPLLLAGLGGLGAVRRRRRG
jgi:hypothetical protein